MKKLLLMILVLGMGIMPAMARTSTQSPVNAVTQLEFDGDDEDEKDEPKPYTHHEVTVGYGLLPATSLQTWSRSSYNYDKDYVGSIYATYTYRFNQVVGIGATVAYDPANRNYYDDQMPELGDICKVRQNNFTVMAHLKINWLNTRVVAMYSKVSLGATFGKANVNNLYPDIYEVAFPEKSSKPRFAYNVAPVGIELGNRQYAAFMQCGFGAEGVFCIGFRYGFGFNKK